jgi:flavin-dependent dehydrogenase
MDKTSDICVIGGGPAGSTMAARLAEFGWQVCLVERAVFPRRHVGESLTPGVVPLLATTGVAPAVEQAGYPRAFRVSVCWDGEQERLDPQGQGLLVDRGHFDRLLLNHARDRGVQVFQPASVKQWRRRPDGWTLVVGQEGHSAELKVRFLVDASGRVGLLRRRRCRTGPPTLALYAYWSGAKLPSHPRIEAADHAWYWGVPLPGDLHNTLVFLDPRHFRARPGSPEKKFGELLAASSLLPAGVDARAVGGLQLSDATPYLDEECVTDDSIQVGDAALALDPLSSSGVQKAIQSSLAGSVVVNTLLRRPQARDLARRFYQESLAATSLRHRHWARSHYARAAASRNTPFWQERAETGPRPDSWPLPLPAPPPPDVPLQWSPHTSIVEVPCVVDQFVEMRAAIASPFLGSPVAYLGGCELAPLLGRLRPGSTLREWVDSWKTLVPPHQRMAIAEWITSRGLVVSGAKATVKAEGTAG